MKDDLPLSAPHLLFPGMFGDSAIVDFPCEKTFLSASTFDHSQNTPDVSLSLHSGEDTFVLRIQLIFHLSFPKMQRVNILASHQPLYMIHQIMKMQTNILNFLIVFVMIYFLLHLITMVIHSLLIFLSHPSSMIYLLMKWKPHEISRHFSSS